MTDLDRLDGGEERPPAPNYDPSPGYEWVVTQAHDGWTTDPRVVAGKRCRYGSVWSGFCREPAVAALDRSKRPDRNLWYGYCADREHMYGRWIEDGRVLNWTVRAVRGEPVVGMVR